MTKLLPIAAAAFLMAGVSGPALAQQAGGGQPRAGSHAQSQHAEMLKENQFRASKVIGADVYGQNKDKIGEIEDLVLEQDGSISHVVVKVGGTLGMGGKNVAVPMSELKLDDLKDGRLTLDKTKEQLEQMAAFDLEPKDRSGAGSSGGMGTTGGSGSGSTGSGAAGSGASRPPSQQQQ
ncbi:MAG: PRC-barrel domain-containing protein [Rhodospirillales bacterium]|nr:PRC-barrel domain-containing protein [Rhodospirillales bacterium]